MEVEVKERNQEAVERTARMMAAAYWRGRFKILDIGEPDTSGHLLESLIKTASDVEWERWQAAAQIAARHD